jgi:hypothetical protein
MLRPTAAVDPSQIMLCSGSLEMIWAPLHGLVLDQTAVAHGGGDEAVIGCSAIGSSPCTSPMQWISQLRSILSACATQSILARLGLADFPRMIP